MYWIVNSVFAGIQTICVNKQARSTLKRWLTFSKKEDVIPPPPKELPKEMLKKTNVDKLVEDVKTSVYNKPK